LTTTWQRFSTTATISSSATQLAINLFYTPVGTAGAADYMEITGVQLELGSVATTFKRAGGTIQGELAACQRYYWRTVAGTLYGPMGVGGQMNTTTSANLNVTNPVKMRVTPTSIDWSALQVCVPGNGFALTSLTLNQSNEQTLTLTGVSGTVTTAGQPAFLRGDNNAAAYLGVNAEL
jgi:hypothetical protein